MYQLYAYGKRYGCGTVALVYPRTDDFEEPLRLVAAGKCRPGPGWRDPRHQ